MKQITSTLKAERTSVSDVSQGEWFGGDSGLTGKVVWRGNLFLVTLAKIFVIVLMVKQITYNAKVSVITILRFF